MKVNSAPDATTSGTPREAVVLAGDVDGARDRLAPAVAQAARARAAAIINTFLVMISFPLWSPGPYGQVTVTVVLLDDATVPLRKRYGLARLPCHLPCHMMRRTAILLVGLVAAAVTTAKALLKDRSDQDHDEIDLAAVAARRRIRMRAKPFIGATILVAAASVELDLRRVHPAPTGVEIAVMMFGGSLRVVTPPGWSVLNSVSARATRISEPGTRHPR